MICRFRFLQILLFVAVTVLQFGEAVSQTRGYTEAGGSPAQLDSAGTLPADPKVRGRIEALLKELHRLPDDPITLNNLAVAHAAAGELDKALEAALRGVEIDAASATTRVNLAAIYDRLGQTEHARDRAAEAVRLDPKSARARGFHCELELFLGRSTEAAGCYRKLNSDFPARYDFQIKFGVALVKSGELSEARGLMERMQAEHPEDIRVINTLGNVYFRMKQFEKSAEVLKKGVELEPEEPKLRYNLGMSYLAAKNRPGALSQYNLIKESSPELAGKLYRSLFQKYLLDVRK